MAHTRSRFALFLAVIAGSSAPSGVQIAMAQEADAPGSQSDTIVVEGIREQEKKIDRFVDDLSFVTSQSPMARYEPGEYCAKVVGLSARRNAEIAARMHQVAEAAGVRPASGDCQTSALVMFADDQESLIAAFRKEHSEYFQELRDAELEFQGRGTPVLAWKLIGRLDRNGQPVQRDAATGIEIVNLSVASSRLQAVTRPVVAMSVVLIQRSAARGLTTGQIADYAFMRSLTETDPADLRAGAPTILRLIDTPIGGEAPMSLTAWDFAYVEGRYASDVWNYGPTQQAKISGTIKRAILGTEDDETDE